MIDPITLEVIRETLVSTVREMRVVDHGDTSALAQTSGPTLTLITCYPFDAVVPGGPLRYVVVATP